MFFENQEFESNIPPYSKRCEAAGIVLTSDLLNACGTATTPRGSGYATNLVGGLPATWANLPAMMKALALS